jgi:hypothetical protein
MPPLPHAPFAACVGSDGAAAHQALWLQAAGAPTREARRLAHPPAAREAWGGPLRHRCGAHPGALGLERQTGPMGAALCQDACLGLCPVQPRTRAPSRAPCPPAVSRRLPRTPPSNSSACANSATRGHRASHSAHRGAP